MIGLADCNNFFVSCERSVDRSLENRAVVVMSNNDGCVVARSNEAKAMGIKMGQPVFEIKDLIRNEKVVALSGDHLLYRDISLRIHDIFRRFVPATLDYSVDESFLDMTGVPDHMLVDIGEAICAACWKEMHIPVTIGFAKTKTLAKIITESSKKSKIKVRVLDNPALKAELLSSLPISGLWGVGRRLTKRLYQSGVYTIADFAARNRSWVRAHLGVNGERSWLELHDVPCIELSHVNRELQDSVSESRTFPVDIDDYDYIRARISIYASDCAKKLRSMRGVCNAVSVYLRTNRFHLENGFYAPGATVRPASHTDSTTEIVGCAVEALDKIFEDNFSYKRAGVVLSDIMPASSQIGSLFDDNGYDPDVEKLKRAEKTLMNVVDRLNASPGLAKLKLASQLTIHTLGHNDGYSSSFQAPRRDNRLKK